MNIFLKATAAVLTALILWLYLSKNNRESATLLTLTACAVVMLSAVTLLRPVLDFIDTLQVTGNLDKDLLSVMLKAVGIGMIAEFSVLICKDSGNETMGKALQILSTVVILCISIPVFERLLSLLDNILGSL